MEIERTVSEKAKRANSFKRQKELARNYADFLDYEPNREERIRVNYGLLNGVIEDKHYNAPMDLTVEGEEVSLGYPYMQHFGLISKVAEAAIGEELMMPLMVSVEDFSNGKSNDYRRKKEELLKEYLSKRYVEPLNNAILAPIMMQAQAAEQSGQPIDQEQLQQVLQKAQAEVKAKTPSEINDYLDYEFKSHLEIFSQKLLNKLIDLCDLSAKKVEGLEDVLALAEVYYLPSILHNTPDIRVINPSKVKALYSPKSPYIQDAIAAVVEEELTFQEMFALDGEYFTSSELKKIAKDLHTYDTSQVDKSKITVQDSQVLFRASTDPAIGELYKSLDLDRMDDQRTLYDIYSSVLGLSTKVSDIYVTRRYVMWRDMKYFKRVKRRAEQGIEYFWEDEHYELNPSIGDISLKKVEKPQVWHCTIYGTGEDVVYVNLEPLPNQYKSLEDIHRVSLPIFGGKLNTRKGNAKNVSPVDNGKVFNYEFDLLMAEYKLKQSSNLGNAFVLFKELKPDDIAWGEWFATLRHLKLILLEGSKQDLPEGMSAQLVQYLKGVDLSTMNEVKYIIDLASYFQRNVYESMGFSPERLGAIGQYMTASTASSAIQASQVQTARIYSIHDKMFLEAVNYLFNITRLALKHNKYLRERLLDDIGQAIIETDWEMIDSSQLGVVWSMSPNNRKKIAEIKAQSQAIIQNQMTDLEDYINFYMSDTQQELRNVGISVTEKRRKMQAAMQEAKVQEVQQAMQMEIQKFNEKFKADMELQKQKDAEAMKRVEIDSMKFAKTMDINQDGMNDAYESKLLDVDLNKWRLEREFQLKERELDIKERELKLAEKKVDSDKDSKDKDREIDKMAVNDKNKSK